MRHWLANIVWQWRVELIITIAALICLLALSFLPNTAQRQRGTATTPVETRLATLETRMAELEANATGQSVATDTPAPVPTATPATYQTGTPATQ